MFFKILCAVIFLDWGAQLRPPSVRVSSYNEYDDNDLSSDLYDKYNAEEVVQRFTKYPSYATARTSKPENPFEERRTLSPMELQEVEGALQQIFQGQHIDNLFQTQPTRSRSKRYDRTQHENTDTEKTEDTNLQRSLTTVAGVLTSLEVTTEALTESSDVTKITKPTRSQIRRTQADIEDDYYDYFEKLRATIKPSTIAATNARRDMAIILRNPTNDDASQQDGSATSTKDAPTTTTTTTTTTKPIPRLDIPALLDIIANLTYEYETNLTQWVNASLQRYSIPTCPTPTISTTTVTTTPTPTTTYSYDYEGNGTGIVMAKCFVCGLEVEAIPHKPYCADAFAGDFIPLVPVDPTARAQIGTFRKYCRYMDVPHYHINQSDPRSAWGRWTGGCSVRWIDLSGVYTQRSCRNRHKPILGRHYASKRLAKLEMGLTHVDNGCIISPAASLVPLSRGISLYARFHACVCTGNWCNAAARAQWSVCSFVWSAVVVLWTVVLGTG